MIYYKLQSSQICHRCMSRASGAVSCPLCLAPHECKGRFSPCESQWYKPPKLSCHIFRSRHRAYNVGSDDNVDLTLHTTPQGIFLGIVFLVRFLGARLAHITVGRSPADDVAVLRCGCVATMALMRMVWLWSKLIHWHSFFGVYECLCVCRPMLWSQDCYVLFSIHFTESTMTWKGSLVVKIFVGADVGISSLELFIRTEDSCLSARSHLFGI
jgi:hypothetical protein